MFQPADTMHIWKGPRILPVTSFVDSFDIVLHQITYLYQQPTFLEWVTAIVGIVGPIRFTLSTQSRMRCFHCFAYEIFKLTYLFLIGVFVSVALKKTSEGLRPHFFFGV